MILISRYLKAFFLVGGIFIGGLYLGNKLVDSAIANSTNPYSSLNSIARALFIVENNYIEEVETKTLVRSAIAGIVHDLDEHSHYFSPSEYRKLKKEADGWYVGIGAELNKEKIVIGLAPKGPASIAGLIVGDHIISIDGENTSSWTLSKIKSEFRGKKGTTLNIEVQRQSNKVNITVVRDDVKQILVETISIKPGYTYIRIEKFRDGVTDTLIRSLQNIEKIDEIKLKGLILDLRNNPGGTINEGISLADLFMSNGIISSLENRVEEEDEKFIATNLNSDYLHPKIVILVNDKSASASELVAGALQFHKRAIVVGEKSYGKGTIQKVYSFDNEDALKLTVGKYLLPSGKDITKETPIVPDIMVSGSIPNSKLVLENSIKRLSITTEKRKELLELLSQLPSPKERQAIPWHLDFDKRLSLDPQLAAAWRSLIEMK